MPAVVKNWPAYFQDMLFVKNKEHNVGVVTLWSKPTFFEKLTCNTIGTCYSIEGIKYLLRNLAGNTNIRYLILCGTDLSKTGEFLKEIFAGKYNVVISDFSFEDLERITSNVEIIDMIENITLSEIQQKINSLPVKKSYGEAKEIPVKKKVHSKKPSEKTGFIIREKNIADAWLNSLKLINEYGLEKKTAYGIGSMEIMNLVTVTNEMEDRYTPKFLQINKKQIKDYESQICTGKQIKSVEYTYGQRLCNYFMYDQIKWAITQLKADKDRRRIFLTLWDPHTDKNSSLPPCLDSIQFLVQNNVLYMTAYFRSHDIFGAYPLNVFGLRKMQEIVAKEAGLDVGELTSVSCSAHIYYNDLPAVEEILKWNYSLKCIPDPRGYFFIEVKDKIYVRYLNNSGIPVKTYSGENAKEIYNQILLDFAVSQLSHAFYIGAELARAEDCLKTEKKYVQS